MGEPSRRHVALRPKIIIWGSGRKPGSSSIREAWTNMILGIHHVQIAIPIGAEDAARKFYCDVLELAEVEKPASLKSRGGFWVAVGDQNTHMGVEDGFDF
jgi:hypothetical protein